MADAQEAGAIGAYLTRQRELRGISLDELEAATRIPRRSLERLEGGCFDQTADGFARGFVRTVSIALGLDADESVTRMLPEPEPDASRRLPAFPKIDPFRVAALCLIGLAVLVGFVMVSGWGAGEDDGDADRERVVRYDAVRSLAGQ